MEATPDQLEEIEVIEYEVEKNRPYIYLYTRDASGHRKSHKFTYRPYFFIKEEDFDRSKLKDIKGLLQVEKGYEGVEGEKLLKITMALPVHVSLAREALHKLGIKTWEADVYAFPLRWLIDQKLYYLYPPVELEYPAPVYTERTVPLYIDIEVVNEQIVLLSMAIKQSPIVTYAVEPSVRLEAENIRYFKTEEELLSTFLERFKALDVDVIAGWNVNYDIGMIISRMRKYGIPYRELSPMEAITTQSYKPRESRIGRKSGKTVEKKEYIIKGREVFDLARAYQEMYGKGLGMSIEEALDIVAKRHLGIGKMELPASIEEVWKTDPVALITYNQWDVCLLQLLEKELRLFTFYNWLRKTAGVRLRDVWYRHRLIDSGLLRIANKRLPSLKREAQVERYEGAVREAKPGIYSNFMLIDFKSFYPSIIMKYNIDPTTLAPDGELVVDEEHKFTKKEALIPTLTRKLLTQKEEARKRKQAEPSLTNEIHYATLKELVNSIYGTMGYPYSRFYNKKCAEAVAGMARKVITGLKEHLESKGIEVLYLDTDSLGFQYDPDKAKREELIKYINSTLDGLEVEEDKFFTRMIIVAKTRYIGKTETGKVVVKGLPFIRGDTPSYFSTIQEQFAQKLLNGVDKDSLIAFLREAYSNLRTQPLFDISVPKGLRKAEYSEQSYHYKAVKLSEELKIASFKLGDKPHILPVRIGGKEAYLAIKPDTKLPPNIEPDWAKIEELFLSGLKGLYTLAGIDENDIKQTGQVRLEQYMEGN